MRKETGIRGIPSADNRTQLENGRQMCNYMRRNWRWMHQWALHAFICLSTCTSHRQRAQCGRRICSFHAKYDECAINKKKDNNHNCYCSDSNSCIDNWPRICTCKVHTLYARPCHRNAATKNTHETHSRKYLPPIVTLARGFILLNFRR